MMNRFRTENLNVQFINIQTILSFLFTFNKQCIHTAKELEHLFYELCFAKHVLIKKKTAFMLRNWFEQSFSPIAVL